MEIAEFKRCINLGLGRAILHLQKHSSEPYRDAILYACLHNTLYDSQLEHFKGKYIRDIIRLSGHEAFYRKRVLRAVRKRLDDRDLAHQLDIVQCLAVEGDKEAKDLLYKIFNGTIKTNDVWCARQLIEVDGVFGFVHLAEKIVENQKETHDDFSNDYFLRNLEDQIGEETAQSTLSELRTTNPKLDIYLKVLEAYRASWKTRPHPPSPEIFPSYEDLKPNLKTHSSPMLWRWGENTDSQSLLSAAIDLEQESKPQILKKYLAIFRYAAYPRSPQKLITLTSHTDTQVARQAFDALQVVESPEVREFALRLLAGEEKLGQAAGLLKLNFEEDDWELIESAVERNSDNFENHHLQMNVREVAILHPSTKGVKCLLKLYEYGGCSFCRFSILRSLVALNALPESIREECFHDSNPDIRDWAKKGFPLESDESLPKRA